jgi:hypothetical protein
MTLRPAGAGRRRPTQNAPRAFQPPSRPVEVRFLWGTPSGRMGVAGPAPSRSKVEAGLERRCRGCRGVGADRSPRRTTGGPPPPAPAFEWYAVGTLRHQGVRVVDRGSPDQGVRVVDPRKEKRGARRRAEGGPRAERSAPTRGIRPIGVLVSPPLYVGTKPAWRRARVPRVSPKHQRSDRARGRLTAAGAICVRLRGPASAGLSALCVGRSTSHHQLGHERSPQPGAMAPAHRPVEHGTICMSRSLTNVADLAWRLPL